MVSRNLLAALAATATESSTGAVDVAVKLHDVYSQQLSADVPVSVLFPPGCDSTESWPLLISLDGGAGDRMSLVNRKALYAEMFLTGVLPPMVVVSFSGGSNQFYHGAWEAWITAELPSWAEAMFGVRVDADHLLLTGMSGGGYGTLKVGLKNPEIFKAIAAMQPVILASLTWPPEYTRARWWLPDVTAEAIWGSPFEPNDYLADHAPNIAISNAANIRASGMDVYLEAGDQDMVGVHDGAEFLHRVLWDQDIPHEYHLVRWADHGGLSLDDRLIEAHGFLAASLAGGKAEPRDLQLTAGEEAFIQYVLAGGPQRGEAPPAGASQGERERALSFMARLFQPLRDLASGNDADMHRNYGRIPPKT